MSFMLSVEYPFDSLASIVYFNSVIFASSACLMSARSYGDSLSALNVPPFRSASWVPSPRSPLVLPATSRSARPERPVFLAVDQQLGEGAAFRVAPELSDPVGPLEVRQHQDVEKSSARGADRGRRCVPGAGLQVRRVASSIEISRSRRAMCTGTAVALRQR
jgi:hypothetical protein